jgi:tripartite-type tricarboxylate transporter receptor subunit TctC
MRRCWRAAGAVALGLCAGWISVLTGALSAQAQSWPDKPVRIILPYAPGGATDQIGRPWADKLTQAFGQQFVIENRGGASGMIGVEAVAKSPPDGYTLLLTTSSPLAVLPKLRKTPYDPQTSFDPVARAGDTIGGFVIHPSAGIRSIKELVDFAKKNPGKISYGSAGAGTVTHMRFEMLQLAAGIDLLHIPYRGSAEALNDILPGTIQMMSEVVVLPHVKTGKLLFLAVNHYERHPEFPEVPTIAEAGYPQAELPSWYAVWAPAGTPKDIINRLNAKMAEISASDDMKAKMRAISVALPIQTPDEIRAFLEKDLKANTEVIKSAKIKLE